MQLLNGFPFYLLRVLVLVELQDFMFNEKTYK